MLVGLSLTGMKVVISSLYGNDYIYVAKQGEPTTPTVEVWGDMNDWAYGLPMTLSEDKTKATISANIDPDTYEFKIMVNGEWRSNAQTFTRQNNSAVGITMNENDNLLQMNSVSFIRLQRLLRTS